MSEYRYAQVDEQGYIISDSYLSGVVESPLMIPLSSEDDIDGKKYNFETKQWEVVEQEEIIEEE